MPLDPLKETPEEALKKLEDLFNKVVKINATAEPKKFQGISENNVHAFETIRTNIDTIKTFSAILRTVSTLEAALSRYKTTLSYKIKELEKKEENKSEVEILKNHEDILNKELEIKESETSQQKFTRLIELLEKLITPEYIAALRGNPPINSVVPDTEVVVEFEEAQPQQPSPTTKIPPIPFMLLRPEKIGAKESSISRLLRAETYGGPELVAGNIIDAQIEKINSLRDASKVRPKPHDGLTDPTGDEVKKINEENRRLIYWDNNIKFATDQANPDLYKVSVNNGAIPEEVWRMETTPHTLKFTLKSTAIPLDISVPLKTEQAAAMAIWDGIDVGAKQLIGTGVGHRTAKVYVKQRTPFPNAGPETDVTVITKNLDYIANTAINLLKINVIPKFDDQTTKAVEKYIADPSSKNPLLDQLIKIKSVQESYMKDSTDAGLRKILGTMSDYIKANDNIIKGSAELAQKRTNFTPPPH